MFRIYTLKRAIKVTAYRTISNDEFLLSTTTILGDDDPNPNDYSVTVNAFFALGQDGEKIAIAKPIKSLETIRFTANEPTREAHEAIFFWEAPANFTAPIQIEISRGNIDAIAAS